MEQSCECERARSVRSVAPKTYGGRYRDHVLEQYRMFLDGMEKNSDRRRTVVQFFIGANTALFALVGFTFELGSSLTKLAARLSITAAGILVCVLFYYLFKSHKQLASAKFRVIEQIEAMLPLKPHASEWFQLKRGRDPKVYFSFSRLEALLPVLFGVGYFVFGALSYYAFTLV